MACEKNAISSRFYQAISAEALARTTHWPHCKSRCKLWYKKKHQPSNKNLFYKDSLEFFLLLFLPHFEGIELFKIKVIFWAENIFNCCYLRWQQMWSMFEWLSICWQWLIFPFVPSSQTWHQIQLLVANNIPSCCLN